MDNKYNTLHYVISELKAYGIKNIISSPGTQNATFNYIVQEDPFFKCYSAVDERSAAYMAVGIAFEAQEPVVITCTGATAARNYLSAMTEAYYSEVPIIALTFYDVHTHKYNLSPQYTDRSVSQNDIKSISIHLPEIKDITDKKFILTGLNAAISRAKYNKEPVHINCPSAFDFSIKTLPDDIWKTEYIFSNFANLKQYLKNKKIGILIGRHNKFSEAETRAISNFVNSYNAAVFCEHSANYNGANKVLITKYRALKKTELRPEIVIDLGGISCIYNNGGLLQEADYWRVVENYRYQAREDRKMTKLLNGRILDIFTQLRNNEKPITYFDNLDREIKNIKYPELPLSTALIVQQMAKYMPDNCMLHLSILIVVQNMNFFDLPKNTSICCNAGGFGIDGAISTSLGQSLTDPNKKCFCITGDLAFFYDMNAIGNRHVGKNLRILLVNNNKGLTMRSNVHLEKNWGEKSDVLVTAAGHFKNGAKGWAKSCGFEYLSAKNKEEYISQIKDFCNKDFNKPILFEVFTDTETEKTGLKLIYGGSSLPQTPSSKQLSKLEKIFSVRNETSKNKKYKVINCLGIKAKFIIQKEFNEK